MRGARPYRSRRRRTGAGRGRSHRLVLGGGVVLGSVIGLVALLRPGGSGEDPAMAQAEAEAVREVRAVLRRMRGAWAPRDLDRTVPGSLTAEQCRPVLAQVLADPRDPLFRPAVRLAVHLGLSDLACVLRNAMSSAHGEALAQLVTAADTLQPWGDEELEELFADDSTAAVQAALLCAAGRSVRPSDEAIAALLVAPAPEVRAAALAALPPRLSPALGEKIVEAQRGLGPEQASEAIRALSRCTDSPAVEAELLRRLEDGDAFLAPVLDALGRRGQPLARPDAIRAVAEDPSRPVSARARAFRCLEQTGTSWSVERLAFPGMGHPVLDYYAARSLLRAGHASALTRLLDVVRSDGEPADESDARLVAEARMGARQLLAQLSGSSISADPTTWELWINQTPTVKVEQLPRPAVSLDH